MRDRKTIFRVDKQKGYSIIDNTAGNDDRLSYGARGVMYKALTKPDDWKFYIQDFANHSPDGVTKVTSYFKELRQAGYIEYRKIRNELGHIIDSEYIFHEKPLHYNEFRKPKKVSSNLIKGFHRNSEKPIHGEPNTRETQDSENPMLLNTDIILNTNTQLNTDSKPYPSQSKSDLFQKHHETKLGRKDDLYQVNILASLLDYSIELYDKVLNAKQNSKWEPRRNQPNTAKWLIATLGNEPLDKKVIPMVKRKTYSAEEYEEVKKQYARK